jgi:uncharacterized lipoprotein YajG
MTEMRSAVDALLLFVVVLLLCAACAVPNRPKCAQDGVTLASSSASAQTAFLSLRSRKGTRTRAGMRLHQNTQQLRETY